MVKDGPEGDYFHGKVFLRADDVCFHLLAAHLFGGQSHSTLMMPHERTIPITPAMAIPPIPILLAYSLNITSGDISLMVCVKAGFHAFSTWSPNNRAIPGTITSHTTNEPAQNDSRVSSSRQYSLGLIPLHRCLFSSPVWLFRQPSHPSRIRGGGFSFHQPNVATMKSYRPPISPASNGFAWLPPFSPETSTCVLAVASGKGYSPCLSLTKYLRKGMRNRIPKIPPSSELTNI